uniref:Uncharacterized protein n=1 Tax=Octopus bimaculoides TaxID=37653 RepID=A0A0L8GJQ5_OCTBM
MLQNIQDIQMSLSNSVENTILETFLICFYERSHMSSVYKYKNNKILLILRNQSSCR